MVARARLERHVAAGDRGGDDERARLDAIGHDAVLRAAQAALALDHDRCRAPSARPRRPSSGAAAIRSSTSGSRAAGRIVVRPSASVAARIAFSVPITVTCGKVDLGAAQPAGRAREVVAVAVLDVRAHRAHRVDVQVDRAATDPVAARVADDHAAEARQQRPEQDEAGAHLGRGLERHEEPLDVARGDLVGVRRGMVDDDADVAQRLDHDAHVLDLGHVREAAALAGQRRRGEHLERGVLAAADLDARRAAAGRR